MSWEDRLREAAYTSPSGVRLRFEYVAVSRAIPKRTTVFDFPGVNDAYVQDNGFGARRYPLRCIFSGPDHDLDATRFEQALLERGIGRLEHPLYGTFDVVPSGEITRRDDLRDEANQSVIEVTFVTSVAAVYPDGQASLRSDVDAALDAFIDAMARQFGESTALETVVAKANEETCVRGILTTVDRSLRDVVADAAEEVRREYEDRRQALELGAGMLVEEPAALAEELVAMVMAPSRTGTSITERMAAYQELAALTIASAPARPWEAFVRGSATARRLTTITNDFHTSLVVGAAAVAGGVRSVLEHRFLARPAAIDAADAVLILFEEIVRWMDQGFEALASVGATGGIDTGGAYQALHQAVALATGYLVDLSFTLLPERRIVLGRPRTIIDLAAELYGQVDERLDFLIDTNDLSGSEVLELPRGREIVFYA